MDPSYSEKSFWRLLRKGDAQKFNLGKSRTEIKSSLKSIEILATADNYQFSAFAHLTRNGFTACTTTCPSDEFVLRKAADNLKRSLNIKAGDRTELTPIAIQLISEARSCTVHKLDISQFFESISKEELLRKLQLEQLLDSRTKTFIQTLLNSSHFESQPGLPRGLSVSPVLAEYYLSDLERACRRIDYCYFYSRYVDDMLFFCHKSSNQLEVDVAQALPKGLKLNTKKSSHLAIDKDGYLDNAKSKDTSISYLGYEIFPAKSKLIGIKISLPQKKIKKIKTRIAYSFIQFTKDSNFNQLRNRIQFISSNFNIGGTKQKGQLYSGIHYNHRHIDTSSADSIFGELDKYLLKLIYAKKGSLGNKLRTLLTNKQRRELASYSLLNGHKTPIYRNFTNKELGEIKAVWQHA